MKEKKFCQNCGLKLVEGILARIQKSEVYEFEDGFYCEACAKARVKKKREGK